MSSGLIKGGSVLKELIKFAEARVMAEQILEDCVSRLDAMLGDNADWKKCRRIIKNNTMFTYGWGFLHLLPYKDYLRTEHWEKTRKQQLETARYKCRVCNAAGVELHVHHRTYENIGSEREEDLVVLCEECHTLFHENRKIEELA